MSFHGFNFRDDNEPFRIVTLKKSFFLNKAQIDQFLVNAEKNAHENFGVESSEYLVCFFELAEKKKVCSVSDLIQADILYLACIDSTRIR